MDKRKIITFLGILSITLTIIGMGVFGGPIRDGLISPLAESAKISDSTLIAQE